MYHYLQVAANVLKVSESVEINAPAEIVWGLAGDFGNLGAFHPAVAKLKLLKAQTTLKAQTKRQRPLKVKIMQQQLKPLPACFVVV